MAPPPVAGILKQPPPQHESYSTPQGASKTDSIIANSPPKGLPSNKRKAAADRPAEEHERPSQRKVAFSQSLESQQLGGEPALHQHDYEPPPPPPQQQVMYDEPQEQQQVTSRDADELQQLAPVADEQLYGAQHHQQPEAAEEEAAEDQQEQEIEEQEEGDDYTLDPKAVQAMPEVAVQHDESMEIITTAVQDAGTNICGHVTEMYEACVAAVIKHSKEVSAKGIEIHDKREELAVDLAEINKVGSQTSSMGMAMHAVTTASCTVA